MTAELFEIILILANVMSVYLLIRWLIFGILK